MKAEPGWHFERLPKRGAPLGNDQLNTFEGHAFEREEDLLVREVLQNAIDAKRDDATKIRIVFRKVTLRGKEKTKLLEWLHLKDIYGEKSLIQALRETNALSELLRLDSKDPLSLLFVEDFSTTGLSGPVGSPRGNWMRFNLHGDASKLREEKKLGTYGYGKSVLSRTSGTNTFLVYTVVDPKTSEGHRSRLMGHTFQELFEFDEKSAPASGRGWFATMDTKEDPHPFINEQADRLASGAGFIKRAPGETGCSFLLIGTKAEGQEITIPAIRDAVELWWWPTLIDHAIDVELWDEGMQVDLPSPGLRPHLRPYIQCMEKIETNVGEHVAKREFNRLNQTIGLGTIATTLVDDTVFSRLTAKGPGPRRVARTRRAAGMVVDYKEFGSARRISFTGVFRGDPDAEDALRFSEPPAHDEWRAANQRLKRIKHGELIVRAVEDRTDKFCIDFQKANAAQRVPPTDRLSQLDKLLGSAFQPSATGIKRRGSGGGGGYPRITEVSWPDFPSGRIRPRFGKSANKLDYVAEYRLKPSQEDETEVPLWIRVHVAEDFDLKRGDPLKIRILDEKSGREICHEVNPRFNLTLKPGLPRRVRIVSEEYPPYQVLLHEEGESPGEASL
jgi:hypothetical protein